jgi:hypothetical protein
MMINRTTMKKDMMIYGNPFIKVMKSGRGYFYAERKGKDSIAVLVYRRNEAGGIDVLIRMQPLVFNQGAVDKIKKTGYDHLPRNILVPCPVTGSITGKYDNFMDYVVEEIKEEVGHVVKGDDVKSLGFYYVGTQTNEAVHCFSCDVTGKEQVKAEGDGSYWENISTNKWYPIDNIEKEIDINYSGLIIILDRFRKTRGNSDTFVSIL